MVCGTHRLRKRDSMCNVSKGAIHRGLGTLQASVRGAEARTPCSPSGEECTRRETSEGVSQRGVEWVGVVRRPDHAYKLCERESSKARGVSDIGAMNKVSENSEASTHVAGRIRVQVGVVESNCAAGDVHAATLPTKGGTRFRSVPGKGIHRGAEVGRVGASFKSQTMLTHCASESRARRDGSVTSIGALELPKMASRLTELVAWLFWMLHLVNVTLVLDPRM